MKFISSLSVIFLVIFLVLSSFRLVEAADVSAPQVQWSKTYDGLIGRSVIQTNDQGYLILGSAKIYSTNSSGNTALMLIKTDASGNQMWTRSLISFDSDTYILQTQDGGYALASTRYMAANDSDLTSLGHFYLAKFDSNGNQLWNRTFIASRSDTLVSFVQTNDGGFALVGRTEAYANYGLSNDDILLIRADRNGALMWNQTYGGDGMDYPVSVSQTVDGGFAIIAYGESFGGGNVWLIRTNTNGTMQLFKRYNAVTFPSWGFVTSDGGFLILGALNLYQHSGSHEVACAAKTDANGSLQWNQTYSIYTFEYGVQTREDGYIFEDNDNGDLITLFKVDGLGVRQWVSTYSGTIANEGHFLIETSDGGYALTGQTSSSTWLLKIAPPANTQPVQLPNAQISPSPNATLAWQSLFQGTKGFSVVQASDGGYALVGQYVAEQYAQSSILMKTDGSGNQLWNKTFRVGLDGTNLQFIVQTSDAGYVLAGTTSNYSNYYNENQFCMLKTDSQGNVLWTREYNLQSEYGALGAFTQTRDGGYALVGNVNYGYYGSSSTYFVKTDPAGTVQWSRTVTGASDVGGYGISAVAVVSTSDGGFSLMGTDSTGYSSNNFKIIHLDSTGNATWTQLYGNQNEPVYVAARAAIQTRDGGYLIGGDFNYQGENPALLIRTDGQGNMLWFKTYETEGLQSISAILQTSDGEYLLGGFTNDFVCLATIDAQANLKDLTNFNTLWANTYDKAIPSIIPTSDGSYVFTGHYIGIDGKSYDRIWLAKLSTQAVSQPTIPEITPPQALIIFALVTSVMILIKKKPIQTASHPKTIE